VSSVLFAAVATIVRRVARFAGRRRSLVLWPHTKVDRQLKNGYSWEKYSYVRVEWITGVVSCKSGLSLFAPSNLNETLLCIHVYWNGMYLYLITVTAFYSIIQSFDLVSFVSNFQHVILLW